eukprot:GDKJ01030996.1.p1 GENE.GDKJ01030996.1~~GDKJ01030996.1.p1  ORF type:complete len:265 (-),score=58.85 GDKJ01030996.1:697-1491(-)
MSSSNILVIVSDSFDLSNQLSERVTKTALSNTWKLENKYYSTEILLTDDISLVEGQFLLRYFVDVESCLQFVSKNGDSLAPKQELIAVQCNDEEAMNTEESRLKIIDHCFSKGIEIFFSDFSKSAEASTLLGDHDDCNGCSSIFESLQCLPWNELAKKKTLDTAVCAAGESCGKADCGEEECRHDHAHCCEGDRDEEDLEMSTEMYEIFFRKAEEAKKELASGNLTDEERRKKVSDLFLGMLGSLFKEEEKEAAEQEELEFVSA